MSRSWLDSARERLDAAPEPIMFFFRDDDAGWGDERLLELLDHFDRAGLPLDVAVIPAALGAPLARDLRARHAAAGRLGLHQHGYDHANHEPEGRKQEFGPARSPSEQRRDIEAGRRRLEDLLGDTVAPIFTPPWNRCTRTTAECLAALGFRVLSREARAEPFGVDGLVEVPVDVDWFAKRRGAPLSQAQIGERLAAEIAGGGPVGVMFHHAVMDDADMAAAGDLLALLAGHPACRFAPILELAG